MPTEMDAESSAPFFNCSHRCGSNITATLFPIWALRVFVWVVLSAFFGSNVVKKPVREALSGLSDGALRGFVVKELGWILGGMTPVSDGITETAPVAFGMRGMM